GAADRAGIAETMTMLEIMKNEQRPHGKICVAFTPDEEIGAGADHFDVERFGAVAAYTLDGDVEGGIEYENFNAAAAKVTVRGFNIHPGDAKDKMINAGLVAMELNALLPAGETPRDTSGYEDFFHLTDMAGDAEKATLSYIIRDHDAEKFDRRQAQLRAACDAINEKYGAGTASVELREQYRNMAEIIAQHRELIERAEAATKAAGAVPVTKPVRGGTDGARLSFMGLPCPNLGTGGHAYHGPFEHVTAEGMDIATDIICRLAER
ncbi:MAG: peptidase T, partial [Clostridia bacterium]|nr:peptidase T [Clostridia bacterium]